MPEAQLIMTVIKIILGALTGTSLMTLFSYMMSSVFNRQFKEPVLLNRFYARFDLPAAALRAVPAFGWLLHYFIGTVFLLVFHFIWQVTPAVPSLLNGALLGFISGFAGVAGWSFMFHFHPDPPAVSLRKYYVQLSAAHVIFGVGAAGGYALI